MFKQSVSLIVAMVLVCSAGEISAREVEVKAGNVRVSIQDSEVEVNTGSSTLKTPSLLERLTNFSLFKRRSSSSSRQAPATCDRSSYSNHNRQTTSSGVSQTSSSSTTMVCQ